MTSPDPRNVDPRVRGWVTATVTYLEMMAPPDRVRTPPPSDKIGVEIRRAIQPTLSFYRYLYHAIGGDWTWTGRRLMDDAALGKIIHDPLVDVNVLWIEGVPAGLAELDRRSPEDIELLYFGLIPDFVGKGLGLFFLNWAVDHAWSMRPERFWVHTCDLDHPNALPVYQKAGFSIIKREQIREIVLHDMPPPRRAGQIIDVDDQL
ncbi:MAG: GNAT family N-acetyltransferase [Geminicoccaceae bacterium]